MRERLTRADLVEDLVHFHAKVGSHALGTRLLLHDQKRIVGAVPDSAFVIDMGVKEGLVPRLHKAHDRPCPVLRVVHDDIAVNPIQGD